MRSEFLYKINCQERSYAPSYIVCDSPYDTEVILSKESQ